MSLYTKTDVPTVSFLIVEILFCISMIIDTILIVKEKREDKKIAEEVKEQEQTKE